MALSVSIAGSTFQHNRTKVKWDKETGHSVVLSQKINICHGSSGEKGRTEEVTHTDCGSQKWTRRSWISSLHSAVAIHRLHNPAKSRRCKSDSPSIPILAQQQMWLGGAMRDEPPDQSKHIHCTVSALHCWQTTTDAESREQLFVNLYNRLCVLVNPTLNIEFSSRHSDLCLSLLLFIHL